MTNAVDGLLRCQGDCAVGRGRVPLARLAVLIMAGGFLYGAVMGTYGGRPLQALYSGIKVPMLLGVSTLICLPSFYVINCLLGLRDDFAAALRGILAAQATLAVCLGALSPIIAVIYQSIYRYPQATFYNGILFLVATIGSQRMLSRHYKPLLISNPRHRLGLLAWFAVYIFVAIQMAWVLRPFIGFEGYDTEFLRDNAWSNAYVKVIEAISRTLTGK